MRGIFGLISQFGKRDHMIRLNAAFRADLEWWHIFVGSWNGVSMMGRESLLTPEVEIWSDASRSWGCGAVWDSAPGQMEQLAKFCHSYNCTKELLPTMVAAAIWGQVWGGSTVMCHCDNQGVVAAVRGGYCKDPAMAHMLRCLFFREAKFGFDLSAVHVSRKDNGAADAISRNNLDTFFDLVPKARPAACQAPAGLVEKLVVQGHWTSDD